ncbi:MAG: FtsH protease activity modulator HflK [Alphaproteobacteria bacterium]|nr:FtsH protease activity modulator HflK [Alphaproteobacteria bacterium]
MPWNNQGGGRGPWGQGPMGGGGSSQPPDLEELLRRGQDRFRGILPGGARGSRGIIILVLLLVAFWLGSGFYRVGPDEQGVVLRFGKWVETTQPGLNYHLPTPIETVITPKVTRINRVDVGYVGAGDLGRNTVIRDMPEESLMLTGDENIIDIDFQVLWQIKDAGDFLFKVQYPEATVKAAAESAMREVIGETQIQMALAEGRQEVEVKTRDLLQSILDSYEAGVLVREIKLQKVDPPAAVIDAFRDVQRARADLERQRNEAEAYANDIIPRARGEAEQILQEAEAYKQQIVAEAEGDAARFVSVYDEYARAKDVTLRRIYLETMQSVLTGMNKVIIDSEGPGVVPYLPLPEVRRTMEEAR